MSLPSSHRNRAAMLAADRCSCYHCFSVFEPAEIEEWIDGGETPVCPRCWVDAVVPGEHTRAEMLEAHEVSFGDEDG